MKSDVGENAIAQEDTRYKQGGKASLSRAKLARKLRDLRAWNHMTQADVAEQAGISVSTVRNYELQKATPKQPHLEALAKAFNIRPEALRLYDFGDGGSVTATAIFQLADVYGLYPTSDGDRAWLLPVSTFMRTLVGEWQSRFQDYEDGRINRNEYQKWQDCYFHEFDPAKFPLRYEENGHGFEPIEP